MITIHVTWEQLVLWALAGVGGLIVLGALAYAAYGAILMWRWGR